MERIEFNKQGKEALHRKVETPIAFSVDASGRTTVTGYVVVYDVPSSWRYHAQQGRHLVVIPPKSMALPTYEVVGYYNHDDNWILDSETDTLRFNEDAKGVAVSLSLDSSFLDQYVAAKIKRGVIKGMSIGLYVLESHWEERTISAADAQGCPDIADAVGETVKVEVYDRWLIDEITITGRPAFPQTSIAIAAETTAPLASPAEEMSREEKGQEGRNVEMLNVYRAELELLALSVDSQ